MNERIALVTGASSGIGEATVAGARRGRLRHVAAARRLERSRRSPRRSAAGRCALDVTDPDSVAALAEALPEVDVIVHSAGGALGLEPLAEADEDTGARCGSRTSLGVDAGDEGAAAGAAAGRDPQIVIVGSVAGVEVYEGGGGYTAAKHAVHALAQTLRLELLGGRIRVTEIAPGMVETEFSLVRFEGDAERAAGVYDGLEPLTAEPTSPRRSRSASPARPHVDVDYLAIKPTAQATAKIAHRRD